MEAILKKNNKTKQNNNNNNNNKNFGWKLIEEILTDPRLQMALPYTTSIVKVMEKQLKTRPPEGIL